jgi:hypothetical protein
MPKVSQRAKMLKVLSKYLNMHLPRCAQLAKVDAFSEDEEDVINGLMMLYVIISTTRYMKARDFTVPKDSCRLTWYMFSLKVVNVYMV